MRYSLAFFLFAVACVILATREGGSAWLLLWPASSFLIVACAYAFAGPRLLGKRADGTIAPLNAVLLLPYFLFTWATWHVQRLLSLELCHNEVAAGLWIGRRAYDGELPPETNCVVDLTSEFFEPRAVRTKHTYICLPTLDARATDAGELRGLVERLAPMRESIYIHCAQGHGRSAALAAAVLLRRGLAGSVDEAERMIRAARPAIRLSRRQRHSLAAFVTARVPRETKT
jgi:protein-tyrosine phosphatase